MNKYLRLFIFSIFLLQSAYAQIEIGGSADFEVSYGGKASTFTTNEIASEYRNPHMAINQLNLFLFAQITDGWFFNSRIQWDTWGTGTLNPARVTLAFVSWEPEDNPFSLTIGRFVNPFGLYPRRQLASENLFVNAPLIYDYFVNISDTRGYWPGTSGNYGTDAAGLTTIYFGGYSTGGMVNWIIAPELVDLSVAVTNAAQASQRNYTNLQNLAVTTRLGFQPIIYWQQGISFSYGSFFQRDAVNNTIDNLEKYRQMLIGTDIILASGYFELSGELVYSMWNVPARDSSWRRNAKGELETFDLSNYAGYADLKYEPPFIPGSYVAVRFEKMIFEKFDIPAGIPWIQNKWDENIMRYSAAVGYKLAHNVLLKFAFSEQVFDNTDLKQDDYTFRSILTVSM